MGQNDICGCGHGSALRRCTLPLVPAPCHEFLQRAREGEREKETERERERQTERKRERERERGRDTQRDRETETARETQGARESESEPFVMQELIGFMAVYGVSGLAYGLGTNAVSEFIGSHA